MYTEKSKLTAKHDTPLFYGSYREKSGLEEIHWQNQKKKRQLCIVTTAIVSLTLLSIGVILAITLPPILNGNSAQVLDPLDPVDLLTSSTSVLYQYEVAGVSSEHSICSDIGKSIMETRNGSVVDSVIAVTLCLGVVSPQSCGLGGGFFMTVYVDNKMYSLNARETVPENVNGEMFLKDSAMDASRSGGLSVGIPGEVAGLFLAHEKFGKLPWADLVKTARDLAQNGFTVSKELGNSLKKFEALISKDDVLRSEFFSPTTGELWNEGDTITRPRLARTLETLERLGTTSFYNGTIAEEIVREVAAAGGAITAEDLAGYSAEWAESIVYKLENNLTMFSLPFPSSGPIVAMALGILQGYGKKNPSEFSAQENGIDVHRLIETLKFTAAHRALIGDPHFDETDTLAQLMDDLLSEEFAAELRQKIFDYQTFEDPAYYGGLYANVPESGTAHVSIIGPDGNAVSLTSTINGPFGAGFMGNQTGIIYNNELGDFSFPNRSNKHGLPPNPYNYVEPGKQPASSMAPLIFLNAQGQPVLATGGAGGLDILPALISATWRALYRESDIKTAIDYPRFSPVFNPNVLEYEYGLPASLLADLKRKGHQTRRVSLDSKIGNVNSVCRTKRTNKILANADYRKTGGCAGF